MAAEQQSPQYTDDQLRAMSEAGRSDLLRTLNADERRRLAVLTRRGPNWALAPLLGATAGGVTGLALGGPLGAPVGSFLGGALGKGAETYMTGASEGLGADILGAGVEGVKQSLLDLPAAGAALVRGSRLPRMLMQRALKPRERLVEESAPQGIRTKGDIAERVLRTPGARLSEGGLQRIIDRGKALDDQILTTIRASGQAGGEVDLVHGAVGRAYADTTERFLHQANPMEDLAAINQSYSELLNHPLVSQKPISAQQVQALARSGATTIPATVSTGRVPVETAQRIKQGTHRQLEGKYGELKTAQVEAQKAAARGLATDIGQVAPAVRDLNAQRSELIVVEDALRDAINRSGNRDLIGFANAAPRSPGRLIVALLDRSTWLRGELARVMANPRTASAFAAAPPLARAALFGIAVDEGDLTVPTAPILPVLPSRTGP